MLPPAIPLYGKTLSLVLFQPRKICPCLTERLLVGRKESNQTNKQKIIDFSLAMSSYRVAFGFAVFRKTVKLLGSSGGEWGRGNNLEKIVPIDASS